VFDFVNDYAALMPDLPAPSNRVSSALSSPLLKAEPARGICKVLCFHPDHSLTLARMTREEIRAVVDAWTDQYRELGGLGWIKYVQIFENRGAMMGASNPHPHGQIWSTDFIPDEPAAETKAQREHLSLTGHCLLCEYLAAEEAAGQEDAGDAAIPDGDRPMHISGAEAPADLIGLVRGLKPPPTSESSFSKGSRAGQGRIIFANEHFMALVPWWAVWPFEVLVLSRRHVGSMLEFSSDERDALADALNRMAIRFDNLFETSFPYTMGFHQSPTDGNSHPEWHFHAHFYPPLLRSATVRKFMVGFEMLGMPQRDITPEGAAERLRAAGEVHFWPRS
jgi:UDPglucose--hexose-1-phosphate uridylyltransferase